MCVAATNFASGTVFDPTDVCGVLDERESAVLARERSLICPAELHSQYPQVEGLERESSHAALPVSPGDEASRASAAQVAGPGHP